MSCFGAMFTERKAGRVRGQYVQPTDLRHGFLTRLNTRIIELAPLVFKSAGRSFIPGRVMETNQA
jgi:hypothetical protein